MRESADDATRLLKAMSSRNRLMLLCQLTEAEKSVGALADLVGMRESAASQQLALLRKDGLVSARRDGQTIYYRLASDKAGKLLATLYDAFCAGARGSTRSRGRREH